MRTLTYDDDKMTPTISQIYGDPDIEYQLAVQAVPKIVNGAFITEREREIVHMRYEDCMKLDDIAMALGLTRAAVIKHLRRVHRVFREMYSSVFPRFAHAVAKSGQKSAVDILRTDNRGVLYAH